MDIVSDNRNGTAVFAERALKNLGFIALAAERGADVHPVTQTVMALLGVIVFPWEHNALAAIKREKLPVLSATEGWPRWEMSGTRRVLEVGQLVHVLRNCVAHGKVEFDSDSRDPAEVTLVFSEVDWQGAIRGDELIEFCRCFMTSMRNRV